MTTSGVGGVTEPKYLMFQMFAPILLGGQQLDLRTTMDAILTAVNSTRGDGVRQQLGFCYGPLALEHTDTELRDMIRAAFTIAEEKDVAVCFHIDDSMFWKRRSDLWDVTVNTANAKNIEAVDWGGTSITYRMDLSFAGVVLAPQMRYNSPMIQTEITRLARDVIGREIKAGVDRLESLGKGHLFAGVIAGWESETEWDYTVEPQPATLIRNLA